MNKKNIQFAIYVSLIFLISFLSVKIIWGLSPIISNSDKGRQLQQNVNFRELYNLGGKHIKPNKITTNSLKTTGEIVCGNNLTLPYQGFLYLEGVNGDSYIRCANPNDVRIVVGNVLSIQVEPNMVTLSSGTYITYNCSALSFTDRTPYPESLEIAYEAVNSVKIKEDKSGVDHAALSKFVNYNGERNLSALVSAQNEVIKDLIKRIESLEK